MNEHVLSVKLNLSTFVTVFPSDWVLASSGDDFAEVGSTLVITEIMLSYVKFFVKRNMFALLLMI